ncbi:Tyrosine-protein kinase [Dirofilaria immitis]|nr:Tyrosine-protein kinase [Dirofilaria immitis]
MEDIPKGLEEEEYFHGLLPREDCNEILTRVGDFLVRVSQPRPTDPREVIISVRVSKEQSPQSVRLHLPILEKSVLIKAIKRQPWEFSHDDITLDKMLGQGAFGEVRSGEAKLTVTEAQMAFRKEKIKEMMHEARLMRRYDHDNIVRIYGVAVDREPLMIVIELIEGGCLSDELKLRKGNVSDDEKIDKMCLGAAYGLQYLHLKKCIHRDIAARNILYTKDKVAKISDFGMSREGTIYKMKTCKKVPIKWTAPETIATFIYSLKTDVYSFSIMVCEVFTDGDEPYKGLSNTEVLLGKRMEIPQAPEGISSLIRHCWDQNPSSRWTMSIPKNIDAVTAIAVDSAKEINSPKKIVDSLKQNALVKNSPSSPKKQHQSVIYL